MEDSQPMIAPRGMGPDSAPTFARAIPMSSPPMAKPAFRFDNEYLLIGIILVLIAVCIMLIVYIVKLKNADADACPSRPKSAKSEASEASDASKRGAGLEGAIARDQTFVPERAQMERLARRRFTPRAPATAGNLEDEQRGGCIIEQIEENKAPGDADSFALPGAPARTAPAESAPQMSAEPGIAEAESAPPAENATGEDAAAPDRSNVSRARGRPRARS